jgi:uridine kinase
MQVRQGIVLVGDTFAGKSCAINALKGLLNDKLLPLFDEFYTARSEEKIKSDEQARKSKDSEASIKMFRAYLNDVKKNVTEKGLVDIKKINPKTLTVEEF